MNKCCGNQILFWLWSGMWFICSCVGGRGGTALSSVIKLKYLPMFATEVMKCFYLLVSVGPWNGQWIPPLTDLKSSQTIKPSKKFISTAASGLTAPSEEFPAWNVLHWGECQAPKVRAAAEPWEINVRLNNRVFVLRLRVGAPHSSTKTSSLSAFSTQTLFI